MKITLTDQEHAYVLAGLRALQQAEPTLVDDLVQGYVADGGFPTLTDSGIDDLCERINCDYEDVDVAGEPGFKIHCPKCDWTATVHQDLGELDDRIYNAKTNWYCPHCGSSAAMQGEL